MKQQDHPLPLVQHNRRRAVAGGAPLSRPTRASRTVDWRKNKRPKPSDPRESGSIEQYADAVMFVYRDEYYLQQRLLKQMAFDNSERYQAAVDKWQRDMEALHSKADLHLEKQRHGPTWKIGLFFEGEFTRFADLD